MKTFTLENRPEVPYYRKKALIQAVLVKEPFLVDTQEGVMEISPDTVDDWEDGYYVAYTDDGSKPYAIAPKYMRENYEQIKKEDL